MKARARLFFRRMRAKRADFYATRVLRPSRHTRAELQDALRIWRCNKR